MAYDNLGIYLMEQHRPADAAIEFRKALNVKPDFAEGDNNLGGVLAGLRDFDGAIAQYRLAVRLNRTISRLG